MLVSIILAGTNRMLMPGLIALEDALRRRRDSRLLASLDERSLADIGIGPSEIDGALRHGRADRPPERTEIAARAPFSCWG